MIGRIHIYLVRNGRESIGMKDHLTICLEMSFNRNIIMINDKKNLFGMG